MSTHRFVLRSAVPSLIALAVASAFPLSSALAAEAAAVAAAVAEQGAEQDASAAGTAAPAARNQLETVIVTAQRRAENIRDVPMSIATVKGDKLDVLTSGAADIRFLLSLIHI